MKWVAGSAAALCVAGLAAIIDAMMVKKCNGGRPKVINPDSINKGDQVTLASANGTQTVGTVLLRDRLRIIVDVGHDIHSVNLAARRATFGIVAHQPRLV